MDDKQTVEETYKIITGIVISLFCTFGLAPIILQSYWGWFIMPLGVEVVITHWHALGLLFLAKIFTVNFDGKKLKENTGIYLSSMRFLLFLLLVWGVGYLAS